MSHVFIVGGAGQVAKKLIQKLHQANIAVSALYRQEEQQAELKALGATPVFSDLTQIDADALAALLKQSEATSVIFSAGAGGRGGLETTTLVDGIGLEKTVQAVEKSAIKQFILVSAFPEAGRNKGLGDNFEHYIQVKKQSEYVLTQSSLDWLILRPGTLLNDEGTGLVKIGVALPYGSVTRDDVASTLLGLIQQPNIKKKIIELTQGDETVNQALQHIV